MDEHHIKQKTSLDLIVVEDSLADFELEMDSMVQEGLTVNVRRVENEYTFKAALDERLPDAILADWTLPEFSGHRALEIASERCPDIPLIFVSGTISENAAIEAVRQGASDYVYRHELYLLGPALKRAINEAEVLRSLRKSENKFKELFETSRDALMILSYPSLKFTEVNKAAQQLLQLANVNDLVALGPADISPERQPDGRLSSEKVQEAISIAIRDGFNLFEWEHKRLDGTTFPAAVLLTNTRIGEDYYLQASVRDISERKQHELALKKQQEEEKALASELATAHTLMLQSEKMATIGQLAAGVAHELNNPIGFVYANLGMLEKYMQATFQMIDLYEHAEVSIADQETINKLQAAKKVLDIAYLKDDLNSLMAESKDGINRVKLIVQNLKDFSRAGDTDEWVFADLHKGLDSTLNIVNNEIKYKAKVVKEYGELPQIQCLSSQLNQVFMNLLVNASHAIKEKGLITIRTGAQDELVWIEIADNGQGIPPENLKKIFDPFFTTKPVGKGTGLGLSLSFGIVERHHGRIEVNSEVGKGTSFRVFLPLQQPVQE